LSCSLLQERPQKQKTHLAVGGWVVRESGSAVCYPNRHARAAPL